MLHEPIATVCAGKVCAMRILLFVVSILALVGCTAPIKDDITSSQIEADTGFEGKSILDIIHSSFTVTSKTSPTGVWRTGVIAMTDSEFFIYAMNASGENTVQVLRLPYSEMQGINLVEEGEGCQVQILGMLGIVALEFMDPEQTTIDEDASKEIVSYIKGKKVPEFSPKRRIRRQSKMPLIIPLPMPPLL